MLWEKLDFCSCAFEVFVCLEYCPTFRDSVIVSYSSVEISDDILTFEEETNTFRNVGHQWSSEAAPPPGRVVSVYVYERTISGHAVILTDSHLINSETRSGIYTTIIRDSTIRLHMNWPKLFYILCVT